MSFAASGLVASSARKSSQLLIASTLSLLLLSPSAAMSTAASQGVPQEMQQKIRKLLSVYTMKDGKEILSTVQSLYSNTGHFVDPLMDTKGYSEISLAFYSLPKIFKDVQIDIADITSVAQPKNVPAGLLSKGMHQAKAVNEQRYYFARSGMFGKAFLPAEVVLEVETWVTYDPQSMQIAYHEDTWSNKGFKFPKFMKRPNANFACLVFRTLGWPKQIGLK